MSSSNKRSLLLATLPSLGAPHFLTPVIHTATTLTSEQIVIVLFSRFFNSGPKPKAHGRRPSFPETQALSHADAGNFSTVQRLLTFVYVQATKVAQEQGKILMDVTVLLKGFNDSLYLGSVMPDLVFRVSGDTIPTLIPLDIGQVRTSFLPPGEAHPEEHPRPSVETLLEVPEEGSPISPQPSFYPVVALGGTFDHLHPGHKILLSMGAWIASCKLIVGITSDSLLVKKPNAHLIEPIDVRMQHVREFLSLFKPGIELAITELTDVYGPTGYDPDVQALVVSRETVKGGEMIASHRAAQNLPALETFIIDVISATEESLEHDDVAWLAKMKLSSTFIRGWIAERENLAKDGM
ncbi:hypothetical protein BKA70DRAFT_1246737 [Coprinopsis sp. MPI-PUGE-AT-0042]|nr:hypothetical protein BKA70DRAFT_1246737 [Coprinopsis sp. MPI-PUGE-AT-0042]